MTSVKQKAMEAALWAACEAENVGHEPNTSHGCWIDGSFNAQRFVVAMRAKLDQLGMVIVPREAAEEICAYALRGQAYYSGEFVYDDEGDRHAETWANKVQAFRAMIAPIPLDTGER